MPIYDLMNPNKYLPKQEYRERLAICNYCPERLKHSKGCELTKFSRCPECGCIISLKAKLSTENCPLRKW